MNYCSNCGKKTEKDNKFCSNCGNQIDEIDDESIFINRNINLNVTNKTTEKIIDGLSQNAQNFGNKSVSLLKKYFSRLIGILIAIITIGLIAFGIQVKIENDKEKEVIKKEEEFKYNRKKSDAKYWDNGNGKWFYSNNNIALRVAIKSFRDDRIYVFDKIYDKYLSYMYGDFSYNYTINYIDNNDGSYDISSISVFSTNLLGGSNTTTYYNKEIK